MLSPLYIYYQERLLMGDVTKDSGAYLRDGCKVLTKNGAALEWFWPYDIAKFTEKPNFRARISAGYFKASTYWRAFTLDEIKQALCLERPVVIGAKIFSNISDAWGDGIIRLPGEKDTYLGSHALIVVGYDDAKQQLIIRNSWGSWGDAGYGYIPYIYLAHVHDIWILS